jgi:hypothetical protein
MNQVFHIFIIISSTCPMEKSSGCQDIKTLALLVMHQAMKVHFVELDDYQHLLEDRNGKCEIGVVGIVLKPGPVRRPGTRLTRVCGWAGSKKKKRLGIGPVRPGRPGRPG